MPSRPHNFHIGLVYGIPNEWRKKHIMAEAKFTLVLADMTPEKQRFVSLLLVTPGRVTYEPGPERFSVTRTVGRIGIHWPSPDPPASWYPASFEKTGPLLSRVVMEWHRPLTELVIPEMDESESAVTNWVRRAVEEMVGELWRSGLEAEITEALNAFESRLSQWPFRRV